MHPATVTSPDTAPATRLAPRRAVFGLVALSVATFVYVTTEIMPIGLLTVMAEDLHRTPRDIGLVVTGYAVVVVLASLPLTGLTARVPRRPLFAVTLGIFTLATVATALAPNYPVLFAARLVAGLTQALFWSVVGPAAAGLFPLEVRGRAIARLSVGTALAPVVGVPLGTWLGQQAGWRMAFLALAGLALLTGVALAVTLPNVPVETGGAARGTAPDVRRYTLLVISCALAVTGFETAYTYITPYLVEVSRFSASTLAPLLLVIGAAGVAGTLAVGRFLDAHPWPAMVVPLGLVAAGLFALYGGGHMHGATVVALLPVGLGFSAWAAAMQSATLLVAPGSTDIASAGTSTAFNVGIAAGSFLGGALIGGPGLHSVALVGAVITVLAAAALLVPGRGSTRSLPDPAAG